MRSKILLKKITYSFNLIGFFRLMRLPIRQNGSISSGDTFPSSNAILLIQVDR